ncbi:hypothetical protein GUITHDRAFT_134941 [Guillardia theta CCMP2712]|uniref:Uncharacterized protein n=1 Tax=Guillardia theta (strain CCMP2712) TaxID=905079 RepID=L1JRY6_GUITC|nr:hypothetical protein GUITHDRAFT_134941 [Guillardia theta CCMP2712]EKX50833.1 hypothetical protein GUITHDRAFT_134941 [Guillardia theta CCMP2712]|eukprot:XP_005837813.1 hypothetical protein GUITHDRAFT_134941 [Guillardia theta CCMP2712]
MWFEEHALLDSLMQLHHELSIQTLHHQLATQRGCSATSELCPSISITRSDISAKLEALRSSSKLQRHHARVQHLQEKLCARRDKLLDIRAKEENLKVANLMLDRIPRAHAWMYNHHIPFTNPKTFVRQKMVVLDDPAKTFHGDDPLEEAFSAEEDVFVSLRQHRHRVAAKLFVLKGDFLTQHCSPPVLSARQLQQPPLLPCRTFVSILPSPALNPAGSQTDETEGSSWPGTAETRRRGFVKVGERMERLLGASRHERLPRVLILQVERRRRSRVGAKQLFLEAESVEKASLWIRGIKCVLNEEDQSDPENSL